MPHRTAARPLDFLDAPVRRDAISLVEIAFATGGVMFMTSGLHRLIQGYTPLEEAAQESPLIQLTGALIYLICGAIIALRHESFLPLIARNWFVFIPVAVAFMSTQWSVSPDETFRRSIALLGTVLFAIYLGGRFRFRELALILFVALAAMTVFSFLAAVVNPSFGVHQAVDGIRQHHAGLWRGLFPHKNQLGPVASITLFVTLALWRELNFHNLIKIGVCAIALVVVVKAGSAQALAQAFLFSVLIVFHRQIAQLPTFLILAVFCVFLAATPVLIVFGEQIFAVILEILGRSPSMSGRTKIWQAAMIAGAESPIFGFGYSVGWRGGADVAAVQLTWVNPGHAHNGFLTMWLDTGLVGLLSLVPLWVAYVGRAILIRRPAPSFHVFSLYLFLFYITTNIVDSFLFKRQDIYVILLVMMCVANRRIIDAMQRTPGAAPARPKPRLAFRPV